MDKAFSVFIALTLFAVVPIYFVRVDIISLCQQDTEPIICGKDICNNLYNDQINFKGNSFVQWLVYMFSSKTFLRGIHNDNLVVIKSLGTKQTFKEVAELFYLTFTQSENYFNGDITFIKSKILEIITPDYTKPLPKLTLCSSKNDFESLVVKLSDYSNLSIEDYLYLWTSFQVNPEVFLLKILQPPSWPVPKYYGVCGQILIVEDSGSPLLNFYYSEWSLRANYTIQLFESAFKFTFQDPDFIFYLTDISPDNIAVNMDGVVKFVDLENIILVDRKTIYHDQLNHTSIHYECRDCFIFDPEGICNHSISDHNIYAVCKEILSDSSLLPKGFLHSSPNNLQNLTGLIDECVSPSIKDRFQSASEIIYLLQSLLDPNFT